VFPERQFPLKAFARQIAAYETDDMGRHRYLQNDGS
jgi:hypothetical protein